jgi:hypothetical protein
MDQVFRSCGKGALGFLQWSAEDRQLTLSRLA